MKIHSLQALRALAAWLVIADHALLEITRNEPQNSATHIAWTLGSTGVYVFFVISGFIMVHICWENFGQRAAIANFLRRRIIRIVPLYWLATLAALAYHRVSATHGADDGWRELLLSFAFIPYPSSDGSWNPILPQGWTLNYEMMFYMALTIGLACPRRIGLAMVGMTLGTSVIVGPLLPDGAVAYLASPIILWFLLGMGLAVFWRWAALEEPARLARSAKLLEPFGDASYSTYLAHGLVLTLLLRIWVMAYGPPSMWIVPVSLVVATAAGWATHAFLERPVLQLINKVWRPSRYVVAGLRARVMFRSGVSGS
jgi:exopolysaccharide production protein ExoZ